MKLKWWRKAIWQNFHNDINQTLFCCLKFSEAIFHEKWCVCAVERFFFCQAFKFSETANIILFPTLQFLKKTFQWAEKITLLNQKYFPQFLAASYLCDVWKWKTLKRRLFVPSQIEQADKFQEVSALLVWMKGLIRRKKFLEISDTKDSENC